MFFYFNLYYNYYGDFMIKVSNLTKIYKSKNKDKCVAIDNISFDLPEKGLVFIIGKSGSGKSTLLNMLGGLDNVTSGEVNVLGNDIHTFNERDLYSYRTSLIGFVFQDFHLLDDLTIEENINFSLKLLNVNNKERVNEVLKEVDLEGYNDRYPNELSGGQKQRVAIARALVKNPNIILADEPTGNLDSNTTEQIMKLIKRISKEKLVIIVSHNLYDAYDYAD
jgi:putative ABC transport system ATP-binding protein